MRDEAESFEPKTFSFVGVRERKIERKSERKGKINKEILS